MRPTPPSSIVRLARFVVVALAIAAAVSAIALGAAAADPPLTTSERELVHAALQRGPEQTEAPLSTLSDATLSAMIFRHAQVETGQRLQPAQVQPLWGMEPPRRDIPGEFSRARVAGGLKAWLQNLAPSDPGYRALMAARCRYQALVEMGGWRQLPPGPVLRPDTFHPHWDEVRERLLAEGYTVESIFESPEPAPVVAALRKFQTLHGLAADGILGPRTRAALDVSAEARLAQLDANLERLRWLPRPLPATRLEVNVAGAEVKLIETGATVLTMRAIVGDIRHKTPIFTSQIDAIVINPPWNVPRSIAVGEVLPRAARDPGYLARNGFRYVDGHLQQRPGARNALGRLKFDLRSPYGVYLHDTPAKGGFAREVRTLSHGCIRLEQPEALARRLLARQGWSSGRLATAIGQGETRRIDLASPLPLLVAYHTAFVEDGELHLLADPYGWDTAVSTALRGTWSGRASEAATVCADPAIG